MCLTTDRSGNIVFADLDNHLVFKVDPASNIVTVIAGNGIAGFSGDENATWAHHIARPQSLGRSFHVTPCH
jgi:hypothetical protein